MSHAQAKTPTAPYGKIFLNLGTVKTEHVQLASTYDHLDKTRTQLKQIENSYGTQEPTGTCLQHDPGAVADVFLSEGLNEVYKTLCG